MKKSGFLICLLSCLLLFGCKEETSVPTVQTVAVPEGGEKYVALTFDDGPRAETTRTLLDGLKERGVVATFFVVGEQIEGNETLILRMKDEGHQIGNHTYTHARLSSSSNTTVVEEIQKTEVVLERLLGEGDYWVRPPYGQIYKRQTALINVPMVYWSVDPEDWKYLNSERVARFILNNVKPGDIILLHDFYPTSVEAALMVVDELKKQGYTFVTVEQLFEKQGIVPQLGELYVTATETRKIA